MRPRLLGASDAHGSLSLIDTVFGFLKAEGYRYETVSDTLLRVLIQGDHSLLRTVISADDEARRVVVFTSFDFVVPSDRRPEIAELITRINYNLPIGDFEMDFDDGQVQYKTGLLISDGQLTNGMLESLFYVNLVTADRYYSSFMSVIHARTAPAIAMAQVQKP